MDALAAWLHALGLERYLEAFRANDVDLDVVRDLTEADLAALGVTLGDRKRLLRAVATLPGAPTAGNGAPPVPRSPAATATASSASRSTSPRTRARWSPTSTAGGTRGAACRPTGWWSTRSS